MNWGNKIAIVYSAFVILILAMVYKSSQMKIDLVTEDYYAEELKYQDKIDALKNTNALETPLIIKNEEGIVSIQFPEEMNRADISGTVHFYKPNNKSLDKHIPIRADHFNKQIFNTIDYGKGAYELKIDWQLNGVNYYQEEDIFL
ncbi:MAG: hypothetical protein HKO56_03215 [Bacteroidia bacterium]|nr:FixH family protein [Bacteroidia bacterium]NNC86354.1 hypothetical protein [Bacteroidia bacterium]NNM15645.1 hypothetical protein [Bacteroidia bacterium]